MAPTPLANIKGLLLDLNGVFYVANKALPGAVETIRQLQESGLPYRFATNNTTESVTSMSVSLGSIGLEIPPEAIISAPYAAMLYLRQRGYTTIYPLLSDNVLQDFQEFTFNPLTAEAVVIGDMGEGWNYEVLNRAFKRVMRGAELIALHKGQYWQWEAGLQLDIGAFVAGLEYATNTTATIVGKPAPSFFQMALQELGLPPEQVAMVGDDIDTDVGGAQAMGMTGILVKTGKYRQNLVAQSAVTPDAELASIRDLIELLPVELAS